MKIKTPPKAAGGVQSIISSVQHILTEMSPFQGVRALLKVNQKDGYDCPGCAWPDPEDKRSMTEFCENGANAIAEEATRKRVTPGVLATHSISNLIKLSDFELGKMGRLTHPTLKRNSGLP